MILPVRCYHAIFACVGLFSYKVEPFPASFTRLKNCPAKEKTVKTIVLRLAPETRKNLEIVASATGRDSSDLVADAVEEYVTRELALLVESHRREGEPSITLPRLGRKKV